MGQFFGKELRKIRESIGLSLRQFAEQMGVSPSYVSDVELGHRRPPSVLKLQIISDILGCNAKELKALRVVDSGEVVLRFNPDDSSKVLLALLLDENWDSLTSDKILLITMLINGEVEGVSIE